MTIHGLHDGLRHTATAMTTQVMTLIALALCTLLAHQLHEMSRTSRINLDGMVANLIAGAKYELLSFFQIHDYAALLIFPAALVSLLALVGLYIWTQNDS